MHKVLQAATAVGASPAIKTKGVTSYAIEVSLSSLAAIVISACVVKFQGSSSGDGQATSVTSSPALAIGSTPERVANGAFDFRINNTNYSKGVVAAGTTFTANHVIGDGSNKLWGVVLVYIDTSGTIITVVPGLTQTTAQVYATAALAHVAADATKLLYDGESTVCVGRILIESDTTTWTANTDNMTNGSNLTTATFISAQPTFDDIRTYTFSGGEITAQRAKFQVVDKGDNYVRLYLSTLTGTGEVTGWITPGRERR